MSRGGTATRTRRSRYGLVVLVVSGCEVAPCEEDIRAQVLDPRVTFVVGDEEVEAELADEAVERERGWKHRRCDRRGLLLVPETRAALPVWGCGLVDPIDLHWIRDGAVVEVVRELAPCSEPCGACPRFGEDLEVDAVLETPAGALAADAGARVAGWPPT